MTIRYYILRLLGYKTAAEILEDTKKGKARGIGPKERKRIQALIRSTFPSNLKYPKKGEIYQAKYDTKISFMTYFMNPYTGGGETILPEETLVEIRNKDKKPISIYFLPVNNDMESTIVEEEERTDPTYNGYVLYTDTENFVNKFKLIKR